MKILISIALILMVAMVSGDIILDKNCQCSVAIVGDDKLYIRYGGPDMNLHVDSCTEDEACKQACVNMMSQATDNGNLASKPALLSGYSVGDYGCRLLAMDVDVGVASLYASICGRTGMKTNFKFQTDFCCRNRKHKDHCAA